MSTPASAEEVAAASAYEDLHVPAIFRQWAPRVARAASIAPGDRVLDVACGTGVLAREAAYRAGENGFVAGLDASAGMLAVARRLAPAIEWRQGLADALPFGDASFDVVVSQFGLMFFADRVAALRDMLRVLVPGGRLAVAVWDSVDRSEAYPIVVEILERLVGPAAADALRAPFALGDGGALTTLFRAAGADSVGLSTIHGRARFPSIRVMVEADVRGWLPVMGVVLAEEKVQEILAEAEVALARFLQQDGSVAFDVPAHIVAASRPT